MIDGARARGLDVTTECYPYTAGMTDIASGVFDDGWREALGIDYPDLLWAATGERLTAETFAARRKQGGMVAVFSIPEEMVRAAIAHPLVIVASDAVMENGKGHPRSAATNARLLGVYARDEKVLPLMEALRKITLMPAQRLERRVPAMRDKGRIRVGADADLTLFDPARVRDRATWTAPTTPPEGIEYVIVGGVPVVERGVLRRDVRPGRPVRAPIRWPPATPGTRGSPRPRAAAPTAARSWGRAGRSRPRRWPPGRRAFPRGKPSGTHGYPGVRKGRGASGIRVRRTMTAATAKRSADHSTTTKYVVIASKSRSTTTRRIAIPAWIRIAAWGVAHRGWTRPRNAEGEPVAGHGVGDPRLGQDVPVERAEHAAEDGGPDERAPDGAEAIGHDPLGDAARLLRHRFHGQRVEVADVRAHVEEHDQQHSADDDPPHHLLGGQDLARDHAHRDPAVVGPDHRCRADADVAGGVARRRQVRERASGHA